MNFSLEEKAQGYVVTVTGPLGSSDIDELHRLNIYGLELNYARGFEERDLSFLMGLHVNHLHVLARWIENLDAVYAMADSLQSLDLAVHGSSAVDLEMLPNLTDLAIESWSQVARSIRYASRLSSLYAGAFDESDLESVASLPLCRILLKDHPRIRSLDGIEELTSLASLGISGGRRLVDIGALARSSPLLDELSLESCKGIGSIEAVSGCKNLRVLDLGDVGEIPSIAPLANLGLLEELYMHESTRVLDGNLEPVLGLSRLRIFRSASRREYEPSVREIQSRLDRL